MRILLLGATGLIGSAVAARLARDGHDVVGVTRRFDVAARRLPVARWVRLDLRAAPGMEIWLEALSGIDAVVNCAGVLQDSIRDSTARVHRDAPMALWRACEEAGIDRIIQFSAMGADRGITSFSRSKGEGDDALMRTGLDWVVLRPSVVVGRAAYGGSALFRGLAALPILPAMPDARPLSIVQLDDVAETVARLIAPDAPARIVLELAGPEKLRFDEVVAAYRTWLGWRPARTIAVPPALMNLVYGLGDLIAMLGWRPPVRNTVKREIARGAAGDPAEWTRLTGIRPCSLGEALTAEPASVQERWFARLYLLKPLLFASVGLFWLLTGLISLGPGYGPGVWLMHAAGAGTLAEAGVIAGAVADMVLGIGILVRRTSRAALIGALLLSIFYLAASIFLLPVLWRDPLGPMVKIWPIMALNLACLAILDER